MLIEITCYPNQRGNGKWIVEVRRDGQPIAWVFRDTEAEATAWAEKNIYVYGRGKTPAYG